jgi:tetratricopeptide (TPR) repeat protein
MIPGQGAKPSAMPQTRSGKPDRWQDTFQRALGLHQRGQLAGAEELCEAILRHQPNHVMALHLSGVIALQTQRTEHGVGLLAQVIRLQPDYAEAHRDFGSGLFASNRFTDALASYDRAIALKPDHAEALYNRALTLSHLGRYTEALTGYDKALALRPEQAMLHNSRAATLSYLQRHEEALAGYARAIALKPDYAQAYSNRALALSNLLRYEEALESCECAIALQPDHAEAHCGRGVVLARLQRHADALASFERAIALEPDDAKAHSGRGVVLADLHRHAEALASFDQAIALRPDHADGYWYQSLCLLALGQFERGWSLHEWRKRRDEPLGSRAFPQPEWLGATSIAGKILFIHWEQGLGDTIQFCRYATFAGALGARVVMSVQAPLQRLLKTVGSDIDIIGGNEVPVAFDCHCPMMSLPLAFGTTLETIPNQIPYLAAEPAAVARWRLRMAGMAGLRVGLCWAGASRRDQPAAHAIDQRRSITLADYAPLARVPGTNFVSLQTGEPAAQAVAPPAGLSLHNWTDELTDLADTAALIAALDLVITVDTAVAHLAGALGKTVWILSRFDACWRWLTDRDDSPWYPTARLWRQPEPGDWRTVVADVAEALRERVRLTSGGADE